MKLLKDWSKLCLLQLVGSIKTTIHLFLQRQWHTVRWELLGLLSTFKAGSKCKQDYDVFG
jgi:hypothetical protein